MTLLVRIAELLLLYVGLRTLFRMLVPAEKEVPSSRKSHEPVARFDGKECDISDADYEEVK
jgi:hypothetical protein